MDAELENQTERTFYRHRFVIGLVYSTTADQIQTISQQIFKSSIALLIFAPASAWLLYHLPRLLLYSDPRYSWYSEMQWDDFLKFLSFPFGPPNIIFIILIISFLAVLLLSSVLSNIPLFTFYDKRAPIRLAIISGILTLCVIFLFNIIKPSVASVKVV